MGGGLVGWQFGVSCTSATGCTAVGELLGQALLVEEVFAGMAFANRTISPVAARFSESAKASAGAREPAAGLSPGGPAGGTAELLRVG